jgi:hypothetical protein
VFETRMRRIFTCSLLLLSLTSGRALANAHLEASEPSAGAVLAQPPGWLRLRFDEFVRLPGTGVELISPDGRVRLLGPLAHDPADFRGVLSPLPPGLVPGRYVIRWRALSSNAHRTRGDFAFTVAP